MKSCLETHPCYFCQKQVTVSRVSPCSEPEKLTGMWLITFSNDFGEKTVGVVCKDCAFSEENKLMLGFSGGRGGNLDNWEAILREGES